MKHTICNPIDLPYRLQTPEVSQDDPVEQPFREAADPSVVIFEDRYYLFASQSGGYWHSSDLVGWEFIPVSERQLPTIGGTGLHGWAPTAMALDGYLYLLFSQRDMPDEGIYRTKTPKDPDTWEKMPGTTGMGWDPQFFYDKDTDRVWLSSGCSPDGVIFIQELDRRTLVKKGPCYPFHLENVKDHGWERPDNHRQESGGWTEGSQLLKYGGTYYLIYSLPSLDHAYANGVYTAPSPIGPYSYAPYSPFAQKMSGFICGAGHGEVFCDMQGNWWNITCQNIGALHRFERRLGIYPTFFEKDGQLRTDTAWGDYPIYADRSGGYETGWMLLSEGCDVTGSSCESEHGFEYAAQDSVENWWCAETGGAGEWLQIDIKDCCKVCAVQINFAEERLATTDRTDDYYLFELLGSADGKNWAMLWKQDRPGKSNPHAYLELERPMRLRYFKLINRHMAFGGKFAVRAIRVFGQRDGKLPDTVRVIETERDPLDPRNVKITWQPAPGTERYLVRYGTAPDRMEQTRIVRNDTQLTICCLNRQVKYWLRIDSVNGTGIRKGTGLISF